jgi:hypothetical protein
MRLQVPPAHKAGSSREGSAEPKPNSGEKTPPKKSAKNAKQPLKETEEVEKMEVCEDAIKKEELTETAAEEKSNPVVIKLVKAEKEVDEAPVISKVDEVSQPPTEPSVEHKESSSSVEIVSDEKISAENVSIKVPDDSKTEESKVTVVTAEPESVISKDANPELVKVEAKVEKEALQEEEKKVESVPEVKKVVMPTSLVGYDDDTGSEKSLVMDEGHSDTDEPEKTAEPVKEAEPEKSAKVTTNLPKEIETTTAEEIVDKDSKSLTEPVGESSSELSKPEEIIESEASKEDENSKAATKAEVPHEKSNDTEENCSDKESKLDDKKEEENQIIQTETVQTKKSEVPSETESSVLCNNPTETTVSSESNPVEAVLESGGDNSTLSKEKEDKSADSDLKSESVVEKSSTTESIEQEVVSNSKPESDKIVESSEPVEKMNQEESSASNESTTPSEPVATENVHTQPLVVAEPPVPAPIKKMSENFSVASLISSSFGPGSSLPKEAEKESDEASKQLTSTSPPVPLKKRCLADSANFEEADPKKAKLNEEVSTASDGGGIVGDVIAEPVSVVKGQGSGAECDTGNTKRRDLDQQQGDGIVGEVVEEAVFRIEGRGSGFECEARNTKAASAKAGAAQKQKSNGVKADNNSNVDKKDSVKAVKGAKKKKEESEDDDEEEEESDDEEDESDEEEEEEEKEPQRKKGVEKNESKKEEKPDEEDENEESADDEKKKKNPPPAPSGRGRGRGRGRGGRGGDVSSRKKKSSDEEGSEAEAGDEKKKHSSKKDKDEVTISLSILFRLD